MPTRLALSILALLAAACGSSITGGTGGAGTSTSTSTSTITSTGSGTGGSGGPGGAGGAGGATTQTGTFACGDANCAASQVCVHPCCGGAPPVCLPFDADAGVCPPGFHQGSCDGLPAEDSCVADPCVPDPPFCADIPAGCDGGCDCLGPVCGGSCGYSEGHDVDCVCG